MKVLVFVVLVFANIMHAQKLEIGFMMAPQVTSSNFKEPQTIKPLHTGVWYHFNDKIFTTIAYTVEYKNVLFAVGYQSYYFVKSFNLDSNGHYFGLGKVFTLPKISPTLFVEIGSVYSVKKGKDFPFIVSTGVFIPFKKVIYQKKQGSS